MLITPIEVIAMAFTPREKISPTSIRNVKIDIAQEHFIRPKIGDELFQNLVQGLQPDFVNDYIKPALAHYVRYGIIGELCVAVTDQGALVYSGENTTTTGSDEKQESKTLQQNNTADNTKTNTASQTTALSKTQLDTTADNKTVDTIKDTSLAEMHNANGSVNTTGNNISQDITEQTITLNRKNTDSGNQEDSSEELTTLTELQKTSADTQSTAQDNSTAERQKMTPATAMQIRMLESRALADANILMEKALRLIKKTTPFFI